MGNPGSDNHLFRMEASKKELRIVNISAVVFGGILIYVLLGDRGLSDPAVFYFLFALCFLYIVFVISFFTILFTKKKQALHDMMGQTQVIRR